MKELIVTTPETLAAIVQQAVRRELGFYNQPTQLNDDESLTTEQAAAVLQQSKNTLRQWRSQGRGPAYEKRGRTIRYQLSALKAWRASNVVVTADSADVLNSPRSSSSHPRARGVSHA